MKKRSKFKKNAQDEKMIAVEKIGERDRNYNDFLMDLTGSGPDDCRFVAIFTIIELNLHLFIITS